MKRLPLMLSAAAMVIAASSQAQAKYEIIRWTSGFCQIWDRSIPTTPFPNDYKRGKRLFKTFDQALAFKMKLVAHRDDAGYALRSSSEHDAFEEMVVAQGLGDAGRQAL